MKETKPGLLQQIAALDTTSLMIYGGMIAGIAFLLGQYAWGRLILLVLIPLFSVGLLALILYAVWIKVKVSHRG